MPTIRVVYYLDDDGSVPVLDWLRRQKPVATDKGRKWIILLADLGHELRRPIADYLGDGIYELRWSLNHVQYRILYFFDGPTAAVLACGLTKEKALPKTALRRAMERRSKYHGHPETHTYSGEDRDD